MIYYMTLDIRYQLVKTCTISITVCTVRYILYYLPISIGADDRMILVVAYFLRYTQVRNRLVAMVTDWSEATNHLTLSVSIVPYNRNLHHHSH